MALNFPLPPVGLVCLHVLCSLNPGLQLVITQFIHVELRLESERNSKMVWELENSI